MTTLSESLHIKPITATLLDGGDVRVTVLRYPVVVELTAAEAAELAVALSMVVPHDER